MAIVFEIPKQSRFIQSVNTFIATFNNPFNGQYSFAIPSNQGLLVAEMNQNSIYFIDRVNVGADISEALYAQNINDIPLASLSLRIENQRVYPLPLPLVNFIDNQEAVAWAWSDKGGDALLLSMPAGRLSQSAELVGRSEIRIFVSFNIYEITDNNFVQQFKGSSQGSAVGFSSRMNQTGSIITGGNASRL